MVISRRTLAFRFFTCFQKFLVFSAEASDQTVGLHSVRTEGGTQRGCDPAYQATEPVTGRMVFWAFPAHSHCGLTPWLLARAHKAASAVVCPKWLRATAGAALVACCLHPGLNLNLPTGHQQLSRKMTL